MFSKIKNVRAWKPFSNTSDHKNNSTRGLPYQYAVHKALQIMQIQGLWKVGRHIVSCNLHFYILHIGDRLTDRVTDGHWYPFKSLSHLKRNNRNRISVPYNINILSKSKCQIYIYAPFFFWPVWFAMYIHQNWCSGNMLHF